MKIIFIQRKQDNQNTPCQLKHPVLIQDKIKKKRKQANIYCILSIVLLYQDASSFDSWSTSNQKKGGSGDFWIKFERMKNEKSLFWTAPKTGPEKCFFVARWKGAQENNSVGKELKYHFQLYCLMAVGVKISPDDITLHCVFQTWKLEAVLSLLRRLLGSCFFSGSSCTLLSLISLLLPISAHCFRDLFSESLPFMIIKYFAFPFKF